MNKRKVNKLRINWPAIIAVTLALGAISYCNAKKAEEYKKQQVHNNMTRIEQTFESTKNKIEEYELQEIIVPESLATQETHSRRSR